MTPAQSVTQDSPYKDALLTKLLGWAAAIPLFMMMVLTFYDVTGRYLFNSPLQGSYELNEVLLGLSVFSALPLATLRDEHVTVSLLDGVFKGRVRLVQKLIVSLVSFVVLSGLAWRLADQANTLAMYDDRSMFLQIPYAWVAYFMTVMAIVAACVILALAIRQLRTNGNFQRGHS